MRSFPVDDPAYGGCRGDDRLGDQSCVRRAIAAAQRAGGGTIVFGPETWRLSVDGADSLNGIVVSPHVNSRGAGRGRTTIILVAKPASTPGALVLTLLGENRIERITFHDDRVHKPQEVPTAFIRMGLSRGENDIAPDVSDIVISHDRIEHQDIAISDGGAPIRRLLITYDEFGAYSSALELAGSRFRVTQRFDARDSVIAFNVFKPGSYLNVPMRQGTMASEIGARSGLVPLGRFRRFP